MNSKLFQNDNITGNSLIGFEIKGTFKDDEDILLKKLKDILNRDIVFSNSDYKLLEPTDISAVVMKVGTATYEIKTSLYSYFEAIFIMPKIMEFLTNLKTYKNSYMYINIGFNNDFVKLSQINILKFILEYNENFILKSLSDITRNSNINKITDIKPTNLDSCSELVQKQIENYKFLSQEDDNFGISFTNVNNGFITFKYAQDIDYRKKWEDILKCMNHTIITLYNSSANTDFNEDEIKTIDELNNTFQEYATTFGCYEMFTNKYKTIKLTIDLNNDKSIVNVIYPSIKEQLFNVVIYNNISHASINYDTDVSRLQIKDVQLNKCYNLNHIDIVNCDIENSCIKDCDLYDTNINDSSIIRCNLFGYSNCSDVNFDDCFISRNIKLKDCFVHGQLGKMGGTMIGGSLKNTTVLMSMADIHNNVEKDNVNEIQ